MLAECAKRIQMMQERMEHAHHESQSTAAQYASKLADLQRAATSVADEAPPLRQQSTGRGPRLETQERARAWEAEAKEKEAAGLKPWEPWADGFKSASAFRAVRHLRFPTRLSSGASMAASATKLASEAARQHEALSASLPEAEASYAALRAEVSKPLGGDAHAAAESAGPSGHSPHSHAAEFRAMVASSSATGDGFSMLLPRASSAGALEGSCGSSATSSARRIERHEERHVGGAAPRGVPSARGERANQLRGRDHSMRAPSGEITGLNALLENSKRGRPRPDTADSARGGSTAGPSHRSPPTLPAQLSAAELSADFAFPPPPAEPAQPRLLQGLPMS